MRKIALVNQKGGVGKTTTAVNLAAALARLGGKVLLIDLDPQSNTTIHLGLNPHECEATTYDLLCGEDSARSMMREVRPNLSLIPSTIELAGAELELSQTIGREKVLQERLEEVTDFDFVLIDCPPRSV